MKRALFLVAIGACTPSSTAVNPSDVFSLRVLGPGTAPADGKSTTTVELCIGSKAPRPGGLTATLTLSRGAWETPTDTTKPQVLTLMIPSAPAGSADAGGCIAAAFVSPTDVAPVFVDATMSGYSERACVQMLGAPIRAVLLQTNPILLTGDETTFMVTATPVGAPGVAVSTSTEVSFAVTQTDPPNDPDRPRFALQPTTAIVDMTGTARSQLIAAAGTKSLVVTATARAPGGAPCPSGAASGDGSGSSASLHIPLLVDAGLADAPADAAPGDAAAADAVPADAAPADTVPN